MFLQCSLNLSYITVNFPYKAALIYAQRQIFPRPVAVFCGSLHLFVIFASVALQVSDPEQNVPLLFLPPTHKIIVQVSMAITRLIYICFPVQAKDIFLTKRRMMINVARGATLTYGQLGVVGVVVVVVVTTLHISANNEPI